MRKKNLGLDLSTVNKAQEEPQTQGHSGPSPLPSSEGIAISTSSHSDVAASPSPLGTDNTMPRLESSSHSGLIKSKGVRGLQTFMEYPDPDNESTGGWSTARELPKKTEAPSSSLPKSTTTTFFVHMPQKERGGKEREKEKEKKKEKQTVFHSKCNPQGYFPLQQRPLKEPTAKYDARMELAELKVESFADAIPLGEEKFNLSLHLLCGNYNFFRFIFSSESLRKIIVHSSWFDLLANGFQKKLEEFQEGDQLSMLGLYENLSQFFLEKKIIIDNSSVQALFYIVLNVHAYFNSRREEEKLKNIYALLLHTVAGRRIVGNLKEDSVIIWINFLVGEKSDIFFEAILSSIDVLENGQVCSVGLEKRQFERIEEVFFYVEVLLQSALMKILRQYILPEKKERLLDKVLALNSPILDIQIWANEDLMEIVRARNFSEELANRVKGYFSLDFFLRNSIEFQRAVNSNVDLLKAGQASLDSYFIANWQGINTTYGIKRGMAINEHKIKWIVCYKEILALSVAFWQPNKRILEIKKHWYDIMIDYLIHLDVDPYDPVHYELEQLPQELQEPIRLKGKDVEYQKQIERMREIHNAITACDERYNKKIGSDPSSDYTSFVGLVERIFERRNIKKVEGEIQRCAKELTELSLKAVMFFSPSEELKKRPFSHLQNKSFDERRELFYMRTDLHEQFVDSLMLNNAISITGAIFQKFGSPRLSLKEEGVKKAIWEVMETMRENECLGSAPSPSFN